MKYLKLISQLETTFEFNHIDRPLLTCCLALDSAVQYIELVIQSETKTYLSNSISMLIFKLSFFEWKITFQTWFDGFRKKTFQLQMKNQKMFYLFVAWDELFLKAIDMSFKQELNMVRWIFFRSFCIFCDIIRWLNFTIHCQNISCRTLSRSVHVTNNVVKSKIFM